MSDLVQIIDEATDAANSAKIEVLGYGPGKASVPIVLYVTGGVLGASETVTLQYHDGTDYRDATQDGSAVVLDEDNAWKVINTPSNFRVQKTSTASALGVARSKLWSDD